MYRLRSMYKMKIMLAVRKSHKIFLSSKGSVTVTVKGSEEEIEKQPFGPFGINSCVHRHSGIASSSMDHCMEPDADEKIVKRLRKMKNNWQKPANRPPSHLVDLIARFLFPFTYGLFNFIYWWTQLD